MVMQTYREASRRLLAQAESELAAGDVRSASEKGWGATSQMVKSVADGRGWPHRSHVALDNSIARLVAETGDDEIRPLFAVAGDLHVNSYENWNNADNVAAGLADVQRLLDKLEQLV